jgi:GNAT superfamily N-acetyltransferase
MSGAATSVAVRRAEARDRTEVLALLAASLGWRAGEGLDGFFDWKHRRNPFGESPAWVALDGERIAGFRTFLRWEFEDETRSRLRAVRAVDTATHPDYQGRGVFRALTQAAVEELTGEGVEFVFNTPNAKSRPGYLAMGWTEVGRLPAEVRVAARPRSVTRLLGARVAAERWPVPCHTGEAAADVLGEPGVADLLGRLDPPAGLRTRRSQPHLLWRYGYAPLGYRAVAYRDDPAAGVAVFRVRARGRAREAALCELLVPSGDRDARAWLVSAVRAAGADYVIRLGPRGLRHGFAPLARLGPVLTWRALATGDPAPPLSRWKLSLGDVELL